MWRRISGGPLLRASGSYPLKLSSAIISAWLTQGSLSKERAITTVLTSTIGSIINMQRIVMKKRGRTKKICIKNVGCKPAQRWLEDSDHEEGPVSNPLCWMQQDDSD